MKAPMRLVRTGMVSAACGAMLLAAGTVTNSMAATASTRGGNVGTTESAGAAEGTNLPVTAPGPVIKDTCAQVPAQARKLASEAHAGELATQGRLTVSCVRPSTAPPKVGAAPGGKLGISASADADAGAGAADESPVCGDGEWYYDRFDMCAIVSGYYLLYTVDPETGETTVVGELAFDFTQDIALSAVTATFSESDEFLVTDAVGEAAEGTTVNFTASCGGTCTATNYFDPTELAEGTDIISNIAYSDSTQTVDSTYSSYSLVFDNPVAINGPVSVAWGSLTYRCDDEVGAYPGCVVPSYTPSLTTMSLLPAIAANIASIQAAGPHHYGSPSYEPAYPLHRTTDWTIIEDNYNTACPPSTKPKPQALPLNLSCDEYPFATTLEGASLTQQPDWGTAMVPIGQQNAQGGYISSFYQANRILNGDAFWVIV